MEIKKNDRKINLVLSEALFTNKRLNKGFTQHRIREVWQSKMGNRIDKYTEKFYFNKGKLTIKIGSAPLRQELNFSKEKIITMINKELEVDVIKEVVIR